jgi:hypothetical protein
MNHLDQLTIELLTNKKHFNKYLSNNDPDKFEIEIKRTANIQKYNTQILHLINEMLFNNQCIVSNDLQTSFNEFLNICFKHFESININEKDEDVLFPYESDQEQQEQIEYPLDPPSLNKLDIYLTNKSFWGSNIKKSN